MEFTLLTCTPDIESDLFRRHVKAVKSTPGDFEHIVFDNNRGADFNHAREINRGIRVARNRYLITLDDDLIGRGDWLRGLGRAVEATGASVAGGIQRYEDGTINHSGGYVLPSGRTGHDLDEIEELSFYPYLCSAVMLIDRDFCIEKEIYFDENFKKYYQEVDFCLRIWEAGGTVVSTPQCDVFHLIGQAMGEVKVLPETIDLKDLDYFRKKWIDTGRFERVVTLNERKFKTGTLKEVTEIQELIALYNRASADKEPELFKEIVERAEKLGNVSNRVQLLGGACFHRGVILKDTGRTNDAISSFRKCLKYNRHHKKAAQLLEELTEV